VTMSGLVFSASETAWTADDVTMSGLVYSASETAWTADDVTMSGKVYSAAADGWAAADVSATGTVFDASVLAASNSAVALYTPLLRTVTVNGEPGTLTTNLEWTISGGSADGGYSSNSAALGSRLVVSNLNRTVAGVSNAFYTAGDNGYVYLSGGEYDFNDAQVLLSYTNVFLDGAGAIWRSSTSQTLTPLHITGAGTTVKDLIVLGEAEGGGAARL
ncbi:unnamed protein product, partial [marine sediment metagenome]